MADGYIENRMADHIASGSARRTAAPMGIRKGVAAALNALSLVSVTTFAQGRVVDVQSPSMRVLCPQNLREWRWWLVREEDIPKWPPIMRATTGRRSSTVWE